MFEEITLKTIGDVMDREPPVLDKDYSLAAALEEMDKAKTDRITLTEEGKIRGILTLRDVIFKLGTVRTKQTTPSALHASSFMTEPVVTVGEKDTLLKAVKEMATNGFTSVPVVRDGEPIGLVSRWELAEQVKDSRDAADVRARDVMRTPPAVVNLQTKILHARQLIFQHDLSVIPVMEEGRFVGVVGVDEIALVFIKYYELSRGEPKRITPIKYVIVADAIKLRPPRVDPDSSIAEVADKMLRHRYRAVVVVDNDKPIGLITGLELAKTLTR
ncbi:MAG: CBS domain-containing protein [Desulfurococcales archaeon]|nr:CBS domain-containing protein [Desulfurococcales archaeon]